MVDIVANPEWKSVRILERDEVALGGYGGNMNEQATALVARTEFLMQEKANSSDIVQGQYSFTTLAAFDAIKATIPPNSVIIIDEDGANQGANTWDGVSLTKSNYDPLTQAKLYTDQEVQRSTNESFNFTSTSLHGGNYYYVKSENLTFDGFITSEGVFTASSAGYKTSDFILVDISKPLVYSINSSTTVSGISFWDANKAFISSINTRNDATQKTSAIPSNTKFIRVSNYATNNPNAYVYITFENVLNQVQAAKDYANILVSGGNLIDVKPADFVFDGYVTNTGSFTDSSAGYRTTNFIVLDRLSTLTYSLNASSKISAISYWDVNKDFIDYVTTKNIITEAQSVPPENTKYIRVTNNMNATPNPYLKMTVSAVTDDPSLIKKDELTIEYSQNLANPTLIVDGAYVNSSGGLTTAAGWKYIKIPVEAGKTYTFGNFVIDSSGYYVFRTTDNEQIAGSNGNFQNANLPKTVTAPASAAYLLIDIARPTNTATQYAQLTVNQGSTLIDYVEPVDVVTKIAGYKLKGSDAGGSTPVPENVVVQGGNATLADIIADSLTTGALIANLPTSSAGLETGQAYIDTATATIKVVM